jgi:hypothetical protein
VNLQSRDIKQLLGKLSKFVCNRRGKVFRAAAARGDRVAKWRLHTFWIALYNVKFLIVRVGHTSCITVTHNIALIIYILRVHNKQISAHCHFVLGVEVWANVYNFFSENLKGTDHMRDFGVDGRLGACTYLNDTVSNRLWECVPDVRLFSKCLLCYIQSDLKVTQPIPDTCSICQKINYIEVRKQTNVILSVWKCPPRSAMNVFTLFLMFDATRWIVPVSRKRFTRRDTVDLSGTGESGNVSLNSFWQVE